MNHSFHHLHINNSYSMHLCFTNLLPHLLRINHQFYYSFKLPSQVCQQQQPLSFLMFEQNALHIFLMMKHSKFYCYYYQTSLRYQHHLPLAFFVFDHYDLAHFLKSSILKNLQCKKHMYFAQINEIDKVIMICNIFNDHRTHQCGEIHIGSFFFQHYFSPSAFQSDVIHNKTLHHIFLLALILEDNY